MTSIEKTTVPIGKAAVIVIFVGGLIANYYTTVNAVKNGISELKNDVKLETNDLRNEHKIINKAIEELQLAQKEMKEAAMSYIGTGMKPEEIKRRNYK